ncbi:metal-dependent hydrolase [Pseudomonas sp. HK3]
MHPLHTIPLIHRRVNFTFDKVEPIWLSDSIKTQFMHALSLFIPTSERIVIEIMRKQLTKLHDPSIRLLISDLIKQEGQHAAMHRRANLAILKFHPELTFVIHLQAGFMKFIQKISSSSFELVIPVAFEHFTAAISKDVLTHQRYWLGDKAEKINSAIDFLLWHCLEELEHQSVCYTIYKSQHKNNGRIILSLFLLWLPITMFSIFIVQLYLLIKDKTLLKPKNWLGYISFTMRTSRLFLKGIFKYCKHNHDVWNKNDVALYKAAENAFNQRHP